MQRASPSKETTGEKKHLGAKPRQHPHATNGLTAPSIIHHRVIKMVVIGYKVAMMQIVGPIRVDVLSTWQH